MSEQLRGIYPIMVTPFDEKGEVDEESLRSQVRFCARAGSHGVVWPVSSSEFQMLSLDERMYGAEAIADELEKLPQENRPRFVCGTAGVNVRDAASLSRHAEQVGADGVVAMPPFTTVNMPKGEIPGYYRSIARATSLPIVVQNQGGPVSNVMSAALIVEMAREIPSIQYVKEESGIATHMISALLKEGAEVLKGVFGGSGGNYLVQEMERGSCGMMSSCHLVDLQVKVWDLFQKGDVGGARDVLLKTLPVQILWHQLGTRIPKEVLKQRGIIKHASTRRGDNVDEHDLKEVRFWLDKLKPILVA
ncbi:dihydrodipicolinate synthase family protein [Chloroflexota bacterium]